MAGFQDIVRIRCEAAFPLSSSILTRELFMNRREFCASALLGTGSSIVRKRPFLLASAAASASAGEFHVMLDNVLDHPFYAWPETLLCYPVASVETLKGKRLVEETSGRPVACQAFTDHNRPQICFLSDLPAGARKSFSLVEGEAPPVETPVKVRREKNTVILDSGKVQVKLPASQMVAGDAPGPILQVARGGEWHGYSLLRIAGHRISHIETSPVIAGPLLTEYRVLYRIDGGGEYAVNVRCIAGYDFVRLREDMDHLPHGASGTFEFLWKDTPFTHRQAPNNPFPFPNKPVPGYHYEDYSWEPIDAPQMNTHIGMRPALSADGEWAVSLGIFQPWPAFLDVTSANFWAEKGSDAAGIFIDRVEEWNDHEYAIWHCSPKLRVRFQYADGALKWKWPIASGRRSTCFSFYDHRRDIEELDKLKALNSGVMWSGARHTANFYPASHTIHLQNMYGTLNLDEVKDWVLTYPENGRIPQGVFENGHTERAERPEGLERMIRGSALLNELPVSGTRQNEGFGPSPSSSVSTGWVPALNRLLPQMNEQQRRRTTAASLLMAYMHAGEAYMPMAPMLSGHPNFLSAVKAAMAGLAFIYPDHPMAPAWKEQWDTYLELNTRYHVRPQVKEWEALGGRWTENVGTYVWGFFRHSLPASFLLKQMDGRDHFAHAQVLPIADWLLNALSAPFAGESPATIQSMNFHDQHNWGILRPGAGPRRVHPPQGAHSERRLPPCEMWYFGTELRNYAPLVAEHLMWAARPTDDFVERPAYPGRPDDPWKAMFRQPDNRGTNPHLRSAKYTGYGVVLRAAVDTPDEISIHLQQIDDGPNYRWGIAAEGGCGVVYFFAAGKGYSHNGFEDQGDRDCQDTDFCTNFGVWKGTEFHSIGQNVLTKPLRDLGVAQSAEFLPRQGPNAYSWPEYQSRSVLLVGSDYFFLYDKLFNQALAHRFSWFTRKGDPFPFFTLLRGQPLHNPDTAYTEVQTVSTQGRWYDGFGDSLVLVSHRSDLQVTPESFGCRVTGPNGKDIVFCSRDEVSFEERGVRFEGRMGVYRERKGSVELALFSGSRIAAGPLTLEVGSGNVAFSAILGTDGSLHGIYHAVDSASFTIRYEDSAQRRRLYVDGVVAGEQQDSSTVVHCKKGLHTWEYVSGLPTPLAPGILRTEYQRDAVRVFISPAGGAATYRVQCSEDGGTSWREVSSSAAAMDVRVSGLNTGRKYHVRAIAENAEHRSEPGPEYPVYPPDAPPPCPAGLHIEAQSDSLHITWGEVLGVSEYRLYAADLSSQVGKGSAINNMQEAKLVNHGLDRSHKLPLPTGKSGSWAVAVSAVSGWGEGKRSDARLYHNPYAYHAQETPDHRFRRAVTERDDTPGPNDGGGRYYPD